MEDIVVTNEELKQMFKDGEIVDTNKGWFYDDKEIEIIAIHEIEPKYLKEIANAQKYKLRFK